MPNYIQMFEHCDQFLINIGLDPRDKEKRVSTSKLIEDIFKTTRTYSHEEFERFSRAYINDGLDGLYKICP